MGANDGELGYCLNRTPLIPIDIRKPEQDQKDRYVEARGHQS